MSKAEGSHIIIASEGDAMTTTEIFFVFTLANVIGALIWQRWQRE